MVRKKHRRYNTTVCEHPEPTCIRYVYHKYATGTTLYLCNLSDKSSKSYKPYAALTAKEKQEANYLSSIAHVRARAKQRALSTPLQYHGVLTTTDKSLSHNPWLLLEYAKKYLLCQNVKFWCILEINHPFRHGKMTNAAFTDTGSETWQDEDAGMCDDTTNASLTETYCDATINGYGCWDRKVIAPQATELGFHIHFLSDKPVDLQVWADMHSGDMDNLYCHRFYAIDDFYADRRYKINDYIKYGHNTPKEMERLKYQLENIERIEHITPQQQFAEQVRNVNYMLKHLYYTKLIAKNMSVYRSNIKVVPQQHISGIFDVDLDAIKTTFKDEDVISLGGEEKTLLAYDPTHVVTTILNYNQKERTKLLKDKCALSRAVRDRFTAIQQLYIHFSHLGLFPLSQTQATNKRMNTEYLIQKLRKKKESSKERRKVGKRQLVVTFNLFLPQIFLKKAEKYAIMVANRCVFRRYKRQKRRRWRARPPKIIKKIQTKGQFCG